MLSAFSAFGVVLGSWPVLLARLSENLNLSPGPLGTAISVGLVASLPSMMLAGRAGDRWGHRRVIAAAGGAVCLALAGFALADDYLSLLFPLLAFAAGSGAYEVAINASAIRLEQSGRPGLMPFLHAAFSAGAALAALATGAFLAAGVTYRDLYVGTAAVVALLVLGACWWGSTDSGSPARNYSRSRLALYRRAAVLLLGALTALAFFVEGATQTWAVIYTDSALGLPALLGASSVAAFHTAMMVGRLGAGWAVRYAGRLATMRIAGIAVAGGTGLALGTRVPALILLGFLIVGLALAAVVPLAYSLVGDLTPDHTGEATAAVTALGYGGVLLGPSLVGMLAEVTGLRLALGSVAAAGLAVALLSHHPSLGGRAPVPISR